MKEEKSWGKIIAGGLAGIVLGFAIQSGAEAGGGVPDNDGKPKVVAPEPITPKEDDKDKNEHGVRLRINKPYLDDGINFIERSLGDAKIKTENPDYVLADFRKTDDGKVSIGLYEKQSDGSLKPIVGADGKPRRQKGSFDGFMDLLKKAEKGHELYEAKRRIEEKKAAPAEKAAPSDKIGYSTVEGEDGLEYALESKGSKAVRTLVTFPAVREIIDQAENDEYCMGLPIKTRPDATAQVEVDKSGKSPKYTLVISEPGKTPTRTSISVDELKKMRNQIVEKNRFFARHIGLTSKDPKTGNMVFAKDMEEARSNAAVEHEPGAGVYTHTFAEYINMMANDKTQAADKKYGSRILDQLLLNFKKRDGWYIKQKKDDGSVVQVQGPHGYAALAEYLKTEKVADLEKALQERMQYDIQFLEGGRPEFTMTVRDKSKADKPVVYGPRRYVLEKARTWGGNAEETMQRVLKANNYTD